MREERVKMGESRILARKRGIRARAWRGKGGLDRERRKIKQRRKSQTSQVISCNHSAVSFYKWKNSMSMK